MSAAARASWWAGGQGVPDKPTRKKDSAEPHQKPLPPLQSASGVMRVRRDRTFARAWLDEEAYPVWLAVVEEALAPALESLCTKVIRIGHSVSLVRIWVARPEEVGEVNWVPDDERAALHLRAPGPGML